MSAVQDIHILLAAQGRNDMADHEELATGRIEQTLRRVDFFKPVATRRSFMQKVVLAGGAAAAGAMGLGKVTNLLADGATGFVPAPHRAQRIGLALYRHRLG